MDNRGVRFKTQTPERCILVLKCCSTRKAFTINEQQKIYLQSFLTQLPPERCWCDMLKDGNELNISYCMDLSKRVNEHINKGTVVELSTDTGVIPHLMTIGDKTPPVFKPVSMSNIVFLSQLSQFLFRSRGVYVEA
jgi:hypothetical protein